MKKIILSLAACLFTILSVIMMFSHETVFSSEKQRALIAIDPGHGGKDAGTVGGGIKEKDINLKIALFLAEELTERKIDCMLIREEDVFVPLDTRAWRANDCCADLFISIHNNSYKNNGSMNGTETLYYPSLKNKDCVMTGKDFASIVQRNLINKLGSRDRGTVSRPNLAVLRKTNMPAVIAEIGYISNANERGQLSNEKYQRKAASALADAIEEALIIIGAEKNDEGFFIYKK